MELLKQIAQIATSISAIATAIVLLIKPVRDKLFNNRRTTEGEKCLLRDAMLRTYYKHVDNGEIRQYEFENFIKLYEAYKSLGGNSFIDEVYEEIREWRIKS